MLSDEEKQAMEYFNTETRTEEMHYGAVLVNLIEKQSKEIEHQKEKRENQKQELAILNAKQIEFNKLVNTVNSYKGQFKRQQKEIEELKEKNRQSKMRIVQLENEITARIEDVNQYYTPNDKIKAKIEELNKDFKEYENGQEWEIQDELRGQIDVLQSLLEKE